MYLPADVTEITGEPQGKQREWRMRGFMEGVGVARNKRWRYSLNDLIIICTARYLIERRLHPEDAFAIARFVPEQLAKWLFAVETKDLDNPDLRRWMIVAYDIDATDPRVEWMGAAVNEVTSDASMQAGLHFLIDMPMLVNSMPSKLREEIRDIIAEKAARANA